MRQVLNWSITKVVSTLQRKFSGSNSGSSGSRNGAWRIIYTARYIRLFWACDLFLIRTPCFFKGFWCVKLFARSFSQLISSLWAGCLLHWSFAGNEHVGALLGWVSLQVSMCYPEKTSTILILNPLLLCLFTVWYFSNIPSGRNTSAKLKSAQQNQTFYYC